MRLFTVRHVTVYRYSEPVGLGKHRWMFQPRASYDLRLIKSSLAIMPQPADLHWTHDVFDNSVAVATFTGQTTELRFESVVTLEHIEPVTPEYRLEPAARTYPFAYSSEERADLARGLERGYPAEDVRQWATGFLASSGASGSMDTMALLRSMTVGINQQFEYRRRVERGVQTPSDTLQHGYGTCRDFALLMIEGVRSRLAVGRGATHAWLQVYLPGMGWVDFDPTNKIIGNHNLIRVAVAWDHAQVLPLWGTFIGRRAAFLGMEVAVSVLDETRSSTEPSQGEKGLQEFSATDPALTGLRQ